MTLQAATTYQGVTRFKVYAEADGTVWKTAVYHGDAGRIPAPVTAVADREFPGATVKAYEFEWYAADGWVHEIELATADGRDCEVSVTPAGALRYVECRLAPDAAPPEIAAAGARLVPGGTFEEVETVKGPGIDEVRVETRAGELLHYLRLEPTGKLIAHSLRIPAVLDVPAP